MEIELTSSTGSEDADKVIRGIVDLLETVFPEQIRGYYVTGSYADRTAFSASDIDMIALFKSGTDTRDRRKVGQIVPHSLDFSPILIDILGASEDEPSFVGHQLAHASLFVYGEDTRDRISPVPEDVYRRTCLSVPLRFMKDVARGQEEVVFPLGYPDPDGEFFGYDWDSIQNCHDTRVLMAIVGKIATALVFLKAREFVATKSECVSKYERFVADQWANLVRDVYVVCRNRWKYEIPESERDRLQLREICKATLEFENHYLEQYRAFLQEHLLAADREEQMRIARTLGEIVFPDSELLERLEQVTSESCELSEVVERSAAKMRKAIG